MKDMLRVNQGEQEVSIAMGVPSKTRMQLTPQADPNLSPPAPTADPAIPEDYNRVQRATLLLVFKFRVLASWRMKVPRVSLR
ncbi:hypothetical protein CEXT_139581 [Caerostris extrusa]|uniref:Uncharacterized protein n=1 Tax=Caerostris extrusa TaxID=172846 RepID=A0AAV4XGA4_CAEEX|nr:hypothetical protein CEXT_139581 [Caerostris extrusa]